MEVVEHLVEWDQLYLRVRGAKMQQIATELLLTKQLPISDLRLEFLDKELRVSARVQKGFSIPVSFSVRSIEVSGLTLQLKLESLVTFGLVPIPRLLFRILGNRGLPDGIELDAETLIVTILLGRFLPECIDMKIESIRIISGGAAVQLGPGGADLPPAFRRL